MPKSTPPTSAILALLATTLALWKHHQTYVDKLNAALETYPDLQGLDLVTLNQYVGTDKLPENVTTAVRNNGGGHYNHSFFWRIMRNARHRDNELRGPSSELDSAIASAFGSLAGAKAQFSEAAANRFGSGWAWLTVKSDGSLSITSTPNQDNTLQPEYASEGLPLLGLDVWEHAYYLKYQNKRPAYVAAWWNVVNWDQVNENYAKAKAGQVPT